METALTAVICQFSFSNRIKAQIARKSLCGSLCNRKKLKTSEFVLKTRASLCSIAEAMQKSLCFRGVSPSNGL